MHKWNKEESEKDTVISDWKGRREVRGGGGQGRSAGASSAPQLLQSSHLTCHVEIYLALM